MGSLEGEMNFIRTVGDVEPFSLFYFILGEWSLYWKLVDDQYFSWLLDSGPQNYYLDGIEQVM